MDIQFSRSNDCLSNGWQMVSHLDKICTEYLRIMETSLFSLDVFGQNGPNVDAYTCNKQDNQAWTWSQTDGTVRSKQNNECLTQIANVEVWATPLSDGSQAVLLLNRANSGSEPIVVQWRDIGFLADQSALVRDLWAHQDLGTFTANYTSPDIDYHSSMLLKITPTQ